MNSYPPLRLDHLTRLSDDTGLIQHALYSVPDPVHGYSVDDQARALMVVLDHARLSGAPKPPAIAYTYLSYLRYAAIGDGFYHNFLDYDRHWRDERGSDDAQGRVAWALAFAARFGIEQGLCDSAATLLAATIPRLSDLGFPRSWAFAVVALYHRWSTVPDPDLLPLVRTLADRLLARYEAYADPEWRWFEDELTYCNGILPAALLLAHEISGEARYLEVGLASLEWLMGVLFNEEGELRLVGQGGWYPRGGVKAPFDEQCVDAQGTVEAALIALRLSGDPRWRERALAAFDWFFGRNVHGIPLVDAESGGCYDGLTSSGVNSNMGAESVVCYALAYLDLVGAGILSLDGVLRQQ